MSVLSSYATKDWLVEGWLSAVVAGTRPASFWARVLRGSIAEVERRLSLTFVARTVPEEPHDVTDWSPASYFLGRLLMGPVTGITKITVFNGNVRQYDVPPSRYHIADDVHRQVQILPHLDGLILVGPTFYDVGVGGAYQPAKLRYTYTAGMEAALTGVVSTAAAGSELVGVGTRFLSELQEGDLVRVGPAGEARQVVTIASDTSAFVERPWAQTVSGQTVTRARIPDDLLELVGLGAAVRALDQIGATRHEAGVASESINDDGFSESISYKTSGRGGAYESIVVGFVDQMKALWKAAARTYAVRLVGVV